MNKRDVSSYNPINYRILHVACTKYFHRAILHEQNGALSRALKALYWFVIQTDLSKLIVIDEKEKRRRHILAVKYAW